MLHALLEHRATPFRLLVGHSKGALQTNNAIQSLPAERTQGLCVVTLGCPIAENVAGVIYHQYLGLFDALGRLNAWGHWPDRWPPTCGRSGHQHPCCKSCTGGARMPSFNCLI